MAAGACLPACASPRLPLTLAEATAAHAAQANDSSPTQGQDKTHAQFSHAALNRIAGRLRWRVRHRSGQYHESEETDGQALHGHAKVVGFHQGLAGKLAVR